MIKDDHLVALGRIEGKVDQILELSRDDRRRLAEVEKQMWWGKGALAVAILSFLPKFRELLYSLGIH